MTSDSYALPTTSVTSEYADITDSPSLTTSTVYATNVYTVTKCPPSVINCPANGYVTTKTVALYTTVCPVTESNGAATKTATESQPEETEGNGAATKTTQESQPEVTDVPSEGEVKTFYATSIHTITKCAPEVTNCPVGSVTTEVSSWTSTVGQSIETVVANVDETVSKTIVSDEEVAEATVPVYAQETGTTDVSVEEVTETTGAVYSQAIVSVSRVQYEEAPQSTTMTVATTIIYKTVVVPPATFKSVSKPAATHYDTGAEASSKHPQGGAAPTGGCTGEGCSATTHTYSGASPAATSQPVTAGASAVRAGVIAMSIMTLCQMLIL